MVSTAARRLLFENVNDEGMRRRRRVAPKHWASCIYLGVVLSRDRCSMCVPELMVIEPETNSVLRV